MNHASLFTGIGGFDLAAEWMGWKNIFQVENDPFCNEVLKKNFPKVKRYGDIKTFNPSNYTGRIDIITGGFPCQPFSQAGARRGAEDDRFLWLEMLRIIQIIKPTWVVAENVRGLITLESGVVFQQVQSDLEGIGYEVQPIIIPAVAVNAPHRRDRVWFIANLPSKRIGTVAMERKQDKENPDTFRKNCVVTYAESAKRKRPKHTWTGRQGFADGVANVANARDQRLQGDEWVQASGKRQRASRSVTERSWNQNWPEVAAELCSVDDGLSVELGKFKLSKSRHRAEQLKAYGNAIVPQVAYEIFKAIEVLAN